MAWTAPRTWTAGENVTKAIMDTHVRDNELFLKTAHAVKLFSTSATIITLTTSVPAAVPFNSEVFDSDGFHDNVTNNSRITIPAGLGGIYAVGACGTFASNATARRYVNIQKNGTTNLVREVQNSSATGSILIGASGLMSLAAGDFIEFVAQQDSGGNLGLLGADESQSVFWASLIGS